MEIYKLDVLNSRFINIFIGNFIEIIVNYLQYNYQLDPLSYKGQFHHIAIDESLSCHKNGTQIRLFDLVNSDTN